LSRRRGRRGLPSPREPTRHPMQPRPKGLPVTVRDLLPVEAKPLRKPTVDAAFDRMSAVARVTESFRYAVFQAEYSLAASGWLRAWLVCVTRIALLLAVPALAVLLLVAIAAPIMDTMASIATDIGRLAKGLFTTALYAALTAGVVTVCVAAMRARTQKPRRW
jgi:hypothetical protein